MGGANLRRKLTRAFAPSDAPYAGGDLDLAHRLGRMLATSSTVIALVMMPFAPPTAAIGQVGWLFCGLTDTGLAAAPMVTGRVEVAVSRQCIDPAGEPVSLTCEFALLEDGMTGDDLLAAADRALLAKKESRRAPSASAASSASPASPPAAS